MSDAALVEELKEAIAGGSVVAVVGTGVSILATANQAVDGHPVARWDGLLRHGVHHCRDVEKVFDEKKSQAVESLIELGEPF